MKHTVVHQKMPAVLHTVLFFQVPVTHCQKISGTASKPNCPVKGNRMRQKWRKRQPHAHAGSIMPSVAQHYRATHTAYNFSPHGAGIPQALRHFPQVFPGLECHSAYQNSNFFKPPFRAQCYLSPGEINLPSGSRFQDWFMCSQPHS